MRGWLRYKVNGDPHTLKQGNGDKDVTPTNFTSVTPTGSATATVCWNGTHNATAGGLNIYQCVSLSGTSFGATITTTLTNQYAVPITNVLYSRLVDPDNDAYWPNGDYKTSNTVNSVQTNGVGTALVGASGSYYKDWWIGISTTAPNSKCGVGSTGDLGVDSITSAMSNGNINTTLNYNSLTDTWISCLINVTSSLAPGESATFTHVYILDKTEGLGSSPPPPPSPPPPSPPPPPPPPPSLAAPMSSPINGIAYGSGYLKVGRRGGPLFRLPFRAVLFGGGGPFLRQRLPEGGQARGALISLAF